MSINECIDKENIIHIHTHTQWNITQALKKEILLFTTTWVKLEGIILSEISQTEKADTARSHLNVES